MQKTAANGGAAEMWVDCCPVVHTVAREISAEYCIPGGTGRNGQLLLGDDYLLDGSDGRLLDQGLMEARLTTLMKAAAGKLIQNLAADSGKFVIVPLNALALEVESLTKVFGELCRSIPEEARTNLIFEVMNLPRTPPLEMVDNLAILLFPFCRFFIARPQPGCTDFTVFTNCNFQGVCFNLKNKPWPVDKIRPDLAAFKESAFAGRMATYLHGCATPEIVAAANGLGIEYLDGSAVKPGDLRG